MPSKNYYNVQGIAYRGFGFELEDELVNVFYEILGDDIDVVTGSEMDKCSGTDLFIYKVPVDLTANLYGKDHTHFFDAAVELFGGVTARFGIRFGNRHDGGHDFETPVLVIGLCGISSASWLHTWGQNVMDAFRRELESIVETGMGLYWDWLDGMEPASV